MESCATEIFEEMNKENTWSTKAIAVERLSYYKAELNLLHPFREGNGRTIRIFIQYLAKKKGYYWDYTKLESSIYLKAMKLSIYDTSLLQQIFENTLAQKTF
ncbi:Fic family protein [Rummeliibacillus sp. SL167]|uniref:Fic family protein n=1 Tax=Rummeliibacillus sp. SL167 TaxID=2579792 RepID=UPI00351A225C